MAGEGIASGFHEARRGLSHFARQAGAGCAPGILGWPGSDLRLVEPTPEVPQQIGLSQQGGVNVYSRQLKDHLVTVLGETPGATVRQMAYSVAHR